MKGYLEQLPSYVWYTCYPQLVSRICHASKEVTELLQLVLTKVLVEHPHQAMWVLVAVLKSSKDSRQQRAHAVLNKAKSTASTQDTHTCHAHTCHALRVRETHAHTPVTHTHPITHHFSSYISLSFSPPPLSLPLS